MDSTPAPNQSFHRRHPHDPGPPSPRPPVRAGDGMKIMTRYKPNQFGLLEPDRPYLVFCNGKIAICEKEQLLNNHRWGQKITGCLGPLPRTMDEIETETP